MKLKQYLTLFLLLLGTAAWGQTYHLEQVTSVEAGSLYVFEQGGYVMNNTISSKALQTTKSYKTEGLEGKESYVWTLENEGDGYKLKNVSKSSYLQNKKNDTEVSFSNNPTSIWKFNFPTDESTVIIQNITNENRFLGYTNSASHDYKAYAASNLSSSSYPHAIKVFKLVQSYIVTADSNNDSYGSVSVTGNVITATPAEGYRVSESNPYTVTSGEAAVAQSGNTFTVTTTADCTVQINFEEIPVATKLYIHTKEAEWKPYIWAWLEGTTGYDVWGNVWNDRPQTTGTETVNGILWHTITVPSDNFNLILSNLQYDSPETPPIPISEDTYIFYNLEGEYGIYSNSYMLINFDAITAQDISVKVGGTKESNISNNSGVTPSFSYTSDKTDVATVDAEGVVTGVASGTANITVSWPTTGTINSTGIVGGSTTFKVTVIPDAPPSGDATFIFNTDAGLAALGIAKPSSGQGTDLNDEIYSSGIVSMTATDGTAKACVWNSSGKTDLRVYRNGGSLTFTVPTGYVITNITFTGSDVLFNNVTNNVWNGPEASSVTLTTTGNCKISTITVHYEQSSSVPAPTFSPASGTSFLNNLSVTLSAEEGCDIYYTTDGTTPTTASTQYSEPFTISVTTTVKAIAMRSGKSSVVASATYTKTTGPEAPIFNPASGAVVKVGSRITIVPASNSTVSHLHFRINEGDVVTRETNNDNYVNVTEDMVGTLIIEAYHTYDYEGTTLEGTHATATYTVVNPQVSFDQPETVFANTFEVTLTKSPEDATVYYTTDGSTPTTDSTPYTGAISLSATTTIKAIAMENGVACNVVTATYEKNEPAVSSESDVFVLVTDDSTLADGDQILVVNGNERKVMDKADGLSDSNREADSFEFNSDGTITMSNTDRIFTLKSTEDNNWILYTDYEAKQYLYTSSGSNWLKVSDNNNETNQKATISIDEYHNAKIAYCNGERWIMLNNNNNIFSCYTGTQKAVQIYRNQAVNAITLKESWDDNTTNASIISGALNEKRSVNLYRHLTADMWNAICLPFDVNEANMEKLFGEGYLLRTFSGVQKNGNNVTLMFGEATTIEAGVPYIVLPQKSVERNAVVVLGNVTLTNTTPTVVTQTAENEEYSFQGVYEPKKFTANDKSIRFLGSGNKFYYPSNENPMRAFRCYFTLPTNVAANLSKLDMALDDGMGVATGIIAIGTDVSPQEQATGHIYSVSGQYVGTKAEGLPKGLYIRDGKKFVVK